MTILLLLLMFAGLALALAIAPALFHLLVYTGNDTTPINNFDMGALADANFSARNSPLHYMLTEPYNMLAAAAQSLHITDARILSPYFAAINSDGMRITGFQKVAGLGGAPSLFDNHTASPIFLPNEEELQFQFSTGTAAEQGWGLMWIAPPEWTKQTSLDKPLIVMEGTVTSFTPTANVWSGGQALNLTANPRGGVYEVVRVTCQQAADCLAFRVIFPRAPMVRGRQYRPGWFVQNVVASFDDVITQVNPYWLGRWGWFSNLELPQVEVLASTSAAMTPIFRFWCRYLGGDTTLLNSIIGQNTIMG